MMTTYQAHLKTIEAKKVSLDNQHRSVITAIQSVIADQICSEIGERYRAHVMALPHYEKQGLLWAFLGGRDEALQQDTEAFGIAMVDAGYLVKKTMYHNNHHGGDIELDQDDIDACCCPIRGEVISKARFEENCYPYWESTEKWEKLFRDAYDEHPDSDGQNIVGENLQLVIDYHAKALDEVSAYAYFELAYTRRTSWCVFVTSHHNTEHPNRKILISGQGHTVEEACADALSKEPIKYNPDQVVESRIAQLEAELKAQKLINVELLAALKTILGINFYGNTVRDGIALTDGGDHFLRNVDASIAKAEETGGKQQ